MTKTTTVKTVAIGFQFPAGESNKHKEVTQPVNYELFRPTNFYTDLAGEGLVFINGIYIIVPGKPQSNILLGILDAWDFSTTNINQSRQFFYEQHGLIGKSSEEIDKYLEDNNLTLPDVPPIDFATVEKGAKIRITAQSTIAWGLSLMGNTRS